MSADPFDAALQTARTTGDWTQVITLYTEATKDPQAQAFLLTHAYVHALEAAAPAAKTLRARLIALGAEPTT